ncbi:gamma-glutamylcyclotransferase [Alicyclobacillus cellulosilyticus]|uniref:Gamma-glutamylcyclotransferase n=1 Tax=Alicyclobacillus cellulosilyticus TaxID=1003997 RepID=A0A917KDG9_9BACL|nr:gamma-glutamylcyclotransferase family protein [Alicyclobacillus cellulosilyticus]GGJ07747.1 gamma-glutamylcyclotransferase [Alicyclobacillus cellulosilyticus]
MRDIWNQDTLNQNGQTRTYTVFVYGTLRRGEANRAVMAPFVVRELGLGKIRGTLYDLGAYPAVVLRGFGLVAGEWVEVTDRGLFVLDQLEGYPGLYDRTIVQDVRGRWQGFVYHMRRVPQGAVRIPGGDWVAWRKRRKGGR